MKAKEIPAIINIEFLSAKSPQGNRQTSQNANAVIDLYDGLIHCDVEVPSSYALLCAISSPDRLIASLQVVEYSGNTYKVRKNSSKLTLVSVPPVVLNNFAIDGKIKVSLSFLRSEGYISLENSDDLSEEYALVFSGAHHGEFATDTQYETQQIHWALPTNSDMLTVSSKTEIPEKILPLITLSYSIFQGGQIRLQEKHTPEEFVLYIQGPPAHGTRLCFDVQIFQYIWNWLSSNDYFLTQCNWLEFFLAGTRNGGECIDFRILNLFVSLNSRCCQIYGKPGQFGEKIAQCLAISREDGFWLSYVRNSMVHEGSGIKEAIDAACVDFHKKQSTSKLNRYAACETAKDKTDLAFALYCDIIDLFMDHLMRTINYNGRIKKMSEIFDTSIK